MGKIEPKPSTRETVKRRNRRAQKFFKVFVKEKQDRQAKKTRIVLDGLSACVRLSETTRTQNTESCRWSQNKTCPVRFAIAPRVDIKSQTARTTKTYAESDDGDVTNVFVQMLTCPRHEKP